MQSAKQNDQKETAAEWQVNSALREAEFGNAERARQQAASRLDDLPVQAALAFARAGDSERARKLADESQRQAPLDNVFVNYWLPTVQAAIELDRKNPAKAIEFLKGVLYESGQGGDVEYGVLYYPAFVRGQAYLQLNQGPEAATEFQKLIDHPSMLANNPLFVLAHLGVARALEMQGQRDQVACGLSAVLHPVEGCRPGYSDSATGESGVREAVRISAPPRDFFPSAVVFCLPFAISQVAV